MNEWHFIYIDREHFPLALEWYKTKYPERTLHTYTCLCSEYTYYNAPHSVEVFIYNWAHPYWKMLELDFDEFKRDILNAKAKA